MNAASRTAIVFPAAVFLVCGLCAGGLKPLTVVEHLRNGGFETAAEDGTPVGWRHRSDLPDGVELGRATQNPHSGEHCAVIRSSYTEDRPWFWWEQPVRLRGGSRYRVSLWLRREDMTRGGVVLLSCLDAAGKSTRRLQVAPIPGGTAPWTEVARELDVPAGTVRGLLQVSMHGSGRLWLDDVTLSSALRPTVTPVASSAGLYPVLRRSGIAIDGDTGDWDGVARTSVRSAYQVSHAEAIIMDREGSAGAADLSFDFSLTYGRADLQLLVEVRDQKHRTQKPYWQGDSIQFALDTAYDRSDAGYGPHDFAIGVKFGDDRTATAVVERKPEAARLTASDLSVALMRRDGGYVVELAVPWSDLGCGRPEHNERMGFAIVVNDSDGKGRKWAQWASGIATGKRPSEYGTALFLGEGETTGLLLAPPKRALTDLRPIELQALLVSLGPARRPVPLALRVEGTGLVDRRLVTLARGITAVPLVYAGGALPAGRQTLGLGSGDTVSMITVDVLPLRETVEHVQAGLVRIRRQMTELDACIERGRAAQLDVAFPDATLATAQQFCRWIPVDLEREGDEELAARQVDRLEPLLAAALREARDVLAAPERNPAVAQPDVMQAVMRDGGWYVGNRPVFLIGFNQFDREFWPDLLRLGGNFDTTGGGAAAYLMRNGPEPDLAMIAQQTVASVKAAAALGIRSDIHFGHRMPVWAEVEHPDITAAEGHFMFYDIDHPAARRLTCSMMESVARAIRDLPGVACYDLWNEAAYHRMSKRGLARFRDAMKTQYGTIDRLNAAWGTTVADFAHLRPVTRDPDQPAAYADWVRWNNARFGSYVAEMREAVRRGDPDALTTVKFSNEAVIVGSQNHAFRTQRTSRHNMGVDRYAMAQLLEIQGCDTRPTLLSPYYAFAWRYPGMAYDLQRSVAPDKPIDDSEWHGIQTVYHEDVDQPGAFLDAALWFSYLHGMDMNLTWWWSRNGTAPKSQWFRGSLLTQPQLLDAWARNSIQVQRFAPQIVAFQDSRARVRILFSKPSAILDLEYLDCQRGLYEALNWFGLDTGFVTEEMLLAGFHDCDLLFIPRAKHGSRGVRAAVAALAARGVTVVLIGDQCLTLDPHGKELAAARPLRARSLSDAGDLAVLEQVLGDADCRPDFRCIGPDGHTSKPVEFRTVRTGAGTLGYLIGLGRETCEVTITHRGKPARWRSLLSGRHYSGKRTVAAYDVDMFEFEQD